MDYQDQCCLDIFQYASFPCSFGVIHGLSEVAGDHVTSTRDPNMDRNGRADQINHPRIRGDTVIN
jgi:hypothetical protein